MLKSSLGTCSIFRIQTWNSEATAPSAANEVLAVVWPRKTGLVASGRADVICLGPTDWLMVTVDPDASAIGRGLDEAFEGTAFCATDVSQALMRMQVIGPHVRDVLTKGCSLDLYPPLFPVGNAARTRLAGMAVVIRCTSTSEFELMVARSHADFLLSWINDAELEFAAIDA